LNETAAKFDEYYYAVYLTDFDSSIPWSVRTVAESRCYVIKKDDKIYYKLNLYQTFWRIGKVGVNGLRDPQQMFNKATSYKLKNYKTYFEKRGESFGEPGICNYLDNDDRFNLFTIYNSSFGVSITYYADGWIKSIHADGYGKEYNTNIYYYLNLSWEYTQIDVSRIMEKPNL
jgi:hypothetical protein